jgi:hypothetical protein
MSPLTPAELRSGRLMRVISVFGTEKSAQIADLPPLSWLPIS